MAMNDQGSSFTFSRCARSVIRLRDDEGDRWYLLTQGQKNWKLRSYADEAGAPTLLVYTPQLADLPPELVVLEQLDLDAVKIQTGLPTDVPHTDTAAWTSILSALQEGSGPLVSKNVDTPPAQAAQRNVEPRAIPLFHLYRTLNDASDDLRQRIAEHFVSHPERLARLFGESVRIFSEFENRDEVFVGPGREVEAPLLWGGIVNGTNDLTAALQSVAAGRVTDDENLDFHLIQREIVPTRATRTPRGCKVDWLLANAKDKVPIVAEIKLLGDKNAFCALVQALMYGATLSTGSQMHRLKLAYPGKFAFPQTGEGGELPTIDIYLVLHDAVSDDPYVNKSSLIANALVRSPAVYAHVRRIACLDAVIHHTQLTFKTRFLATRADGMMND